MREARVSYRVRWEAVNAAQNAELRRLSPDERLDQLLQLFELGTVFRHDPRDVRELAVVRKRWAKLRRRTLARR